MGKPTGVYLPRYDLYSLLFMSISWALGQSTLPWEGDSVTLRQEEAADWAEMLVKKYAPSLTVQQRLRLAKRIEDFQCKFPWAIIPQRWEKLKDYFKSSNC